MSVNRRSRGHEISHDDTFASTIPDLQRKLEEESDWMEWRQTFFEMAKAGRALELKYDKACERIEALEKKEAERKGALRILDWIIKFAIGAAGLWLGLHSKRG